LRFIFHSSLFCSLIVTSLIAIRYKTKHQVLRKKILKTVYQETSLVNFENIDLSKQDLLVSGPIKSSIKIHRSYPAPIKNSKKYLGWNIEGINLGHIVLNFGSSPKIKDHCYQINIWVYGNMNKAILYITLEDTLKNIHTLKVGSLKFRGWKKLTVVLPDHVNQQNLQINSQNEIRLIKLRVDPGPKSRFQPWQQFYIDDIIAITRPKYLLPDD